MTELEEKSFGLLVSERKNNYYILWERIYIYMGEGRWERGREREGGRGMERENECKSIGIPLKIKYSDHWHT